jgi:hypothetical protein
MRPARHIVRSTGLDTLNFLCCSSKRSNSHVGEKADTEDSVNKVEASDGDAYPHMKEDKVCLILTFLHMFS